MKNMMIFPYHSDVEILLRNQRALKDRRIVNILSFPENQERLNGLKEKYITENNQEVTENELLVLNLAEGVFSEKYEEKIEELKAQGMPVRYLKRQDKNSIEKVHSYNEGQYEKRRYSVPVPVIAILGQGINCSKFESLLMTKQTTDKMGYESLVISSNELGGLYGFYSYPDFLWKENVGLEEKVVSINHYIYDLYMQEKPDLILLEIPGGISKMGEKDENHFSEFAHVITNSVDIDSGILSLYFSKSYEESYLNHIRQYCFFKYGVEIEMVISARQRTDYSMDSESWEYYFLNDQILNNILEESGKESVIPNISEVDRCIWNIQNMIEEFTNIYERV